MKLKVVRPSQGLVWAREGMRLCARQPLGFLSLMGLMAAAMMMLVALPLVGTVIVLMAMPGLWMVFMLASRRVLSQQRITPQLFMEPFQDSEARVRWLKLGALYASVSALAFVLAGLLGPSVQELSTALEAAEQTGNVLADPVVRASLLWRALLALPVSLLFWHTPALVHWGHQPVAKALFFSAVASWRNLGAFAVYGLVWLGALAAVGTLVQLFAALLPLPMFGAVAAVAGGMWTAAAFYASLYFSVVDCFEAGPPGQAAQGSAAPGALP